MSLKLRKLVSCRATPLYVFISPPITITNARSHPLLYPTCHIPQRRSTFGPVAYTFVPTLASANVSLDIRNIFGTPFNGIAETRASNYVRDMYLGSGITDLSKAGINLRENVQHRLSGHSTIAELITHVHSICTHVHPIITPGNKYQGQFWLVDDCDTMV